MPHKLTRFAKRFGDEAAQAIALVHEAEEMCLPDPSGQEIAYIPIHYTRIEYIYELAFLRIFMGWEIFLEDTILRCLLGFHTRTGKPTLIPGKKFLKTIKAAKMEIFTGKHKGGYVLWGNVDLALKVITKHIDNGRHEYVMRGGHSSPTSLLLDQEPSRSWDRGCLQEVQQDLYKADAETVSRSTRREIAKGLG